MALWTIVQNWSGSKTKALGPLEDNRASRTYMTIHHSLCVGRELLGFYVLYILNVCFLFVLVNVTLSDGLSRFRLSVWSTWRKRETLCALGWMSLRRPAYGTCSGLKETELRRMWSRLTVCLIPFLLTPLRYGEVGSLQNFSYNSASFYKRYR